MERLVELEWLDELPATDQRAVRSRQDLRRINALMGNASLVAEALRQRWVPGEVCNLVELGAGDGSFALAVAQRISATVRISEVTLVDRLAPRNGPIAAAFAKVGCPLDLVTADVFDWLTEAEPTCVIVANLFLHHFEADRLQQLLQLAAQRSSIFVACEPRRSALALVGSRLLGLIGCNDVTRHDAVASVRAGFAGRELSARWPQGDEWILEEGAARAFSHRFIARRIRPA